MSRHHEASALLGSVQEIVATRPVGAEPPGWAIRRGWAEFLDGLSDDAVAAAERDGLAAHLAGAPSDLVALAHGVRQVTDLPDAPGPPAALVESRRASARKRVQVAAFGELVAGLPRRPERIVDVGSGHGHLTRALARALDVAAEGWERDAARVAVASALSEGQPVRFVTADLRETGPDLTEADLLVGLHACGELGDLAVRAARSAGASVALVACCLQKYPGDRVPLVVPPGLTAEALTIPRAALGLANTRTGEQGIEADLQTRRLSRRNRFVVGRALRDAGHPVVAGEELRGVNRRHATRDLAVLAALVFRARGLPPPTRAALDEAARAAPDFERERRWALPRAMLGRLIEVWAALDRAALLVEAGLSGEVRLAFDASASPRNVAVLGWDGVRAGAV